MPKAIVAAIATLITIGLTFVYAAVDEHRFLTYLPYAIRGSADAPPPSSLDERVLALETQVAQLAKLLTPTPVPTATPSPTPTLTPTATPTPAVFPVYASSVPIYTAPAGYSSTFTASISQYPYPGAWYAAIVTGTLRYNGVPFANTLVTGVYSNAEGRWYPNRRTDSSGTFSTTLTLHETDMGRIIPLTLEIPVPISIAPSGYIHEVRYIELR